MLRFAFFFIIGVLLDEDWGKAGIPDAHKIFESRIETGRGILRHTRHNHIRSGYQRYKGDSHYTGRYR